MFLLRKHEGLIEDVVKSYDRQTLPKDVIGMGDRLAPQKVPREMVVLVARYPFHIPC